MDSVFVPQPLSDHRKFYQIMKNKKTEETQSKMAKQKREQPNARKAVQPGNITML
jgi:hypothetical protein